MILRTGQIKLIRNYYKLGICPILTRYYHQGCEIRKLVQKVTHLAFNIQENRDSENLVNLSPQITGDIRDDDRTMKWTQMCPVKRRQALNH
jgi:hypothetical protein